MFNRSAGGSIGGGYASFLCLKRLSVLSCRVRSTSTTFRSSISKSISRDLDSDEFIYPSVTLHHGSSHSVANYPDTVIISIMRPYRDLAWRQKKKISGTRRISFRFPAIAATYLYVVVPICNCDPFDDIVRSLALGSSRCFLRRNAGNSSCFRNDATINEEKFVNRDRKGTIVTDSVRRMSAKSQHLLVRISPDVIVYHVIGASEALTKKC